MNLRKAKKISSQYLFSIKRKSGESYFHHGIKVASLLRRVTKDKGLLVATILHDLLSHPRGGFLIKKLGLNKEERLLIKEMHKLRKLRLDNNVEDLDIFISAFTKDIRLLLFRMAHRLNDIRNINCFEPKIRKMIAEETLHMYTSLAGRLGINAWRHEMETACFNIIYPRISKKLEEKFKSCREIDITSLNLIKDFLVKILKKEKIKAKIEYRIKSPYSTYRKMIFKKKKFEELTDRLAVRVIVDKISDCYMVLGIIHNKMHPIPGKLKDYIGTPKENGYQSIHTVVYITPGITQQPIEIQIRTRAIHLASEFGISSHYNYKDLIYSMKTGAVHVDLFRNLEILRREVKSPRQFEAALKTYFDENRLLIFDSRNNLYHIKRPATALDFACQVYEKKCKKIKYVFVNGRKDSFDKILKDGDVLKIFFSKKPTIKKKWLSFCLQKQTKKIIKKILGKNKMLTFHDIITKL